MCAVGAFIAAEYERIVVCGVGLTGREYEHFREPWYAFAPRIRPYAYAVSGFLTEILEPWEALLCE